MQSQSSSRGFGWVSLVMIATVVVSVGFSFYKYYFLKDYTVYLKDLCDPNISECLSEECDVEDPRCKPSEDGLMYYQESYRKADITR